MCSIYSRYRIECDVVLICCSYFSQTVKLLKEDKSLYCISAWNDFVSKVFQGEFVNYRIKLF